MNASLLLQYLVVALAVVFSAWIVMKKQFPNATRKLRIAIAIPLVREGQPSWLRALGKRIAPPAKAAAHCGNDGCDGCGD